MSEDSPVLVIEQLARTVTRPPGSSIPEAPPEAPPQMPETEPRPAPSAPPEHKPDLDPFNPDWPPGRAEPRPKA